MKKKLYKNINKHIKKNKKYIKEKNFTIVQKLVTFPI